MFPDPRGDKIERARLIFMGKELDYSITIKDAGITDEAKLTVVMVIKGDRIYQSDEEKQMDVQELVVLKALDEAAKLDGDREARNARFQSTSLELVDIDDQIARLQLKRASVAKDKEKFGAEVKVLDGMIKEMTDQLANLDITKLTCFRPDIPWKWSEILDRREVDGKVEYYTKFLLFEEPYWTKATSLHGAEEGIALYKSLLDKARAAALDAAIEDSQATNKQFYICDLGKCAKTDIGEVTTFVVISKSNKAKHNSRLHKDVVIEPPGRRWTKVSTSKKPKNDEDN